MSILSNSVNLLNAGLRAAGGEEVTYRRGAAAIDNVVAVPARTRHDDYGAEEASATSLDRDWIIWAADLTKDGGRWLPQRGDAIDWTDLAGVLRTYNVLPRDGERCYAPTDPSHQQLRVFTVETKARKE